jgi:coiled-coil domain-containing protein 14
MYFSKCYFQLVNFLSSGDVEFKRIVSELETSVNNVSPVKGAFNLQAEIDLAVQPLRSENCQLRRRLRILNQQLKERERKEKENVKPDTSFECK